MRIGPCVVICDLSLPNEDRATGKALCEGVGALPTLLSPTVAALLVTMFGGMNVEGIRPLYWIQFAAQVILVVYAAMRMVKVERAPRKTKSINPIEDFREVFRRGTATKRWLLFLATNYFTMSMITPFMYPFAHEVKGAGPFVIGGITTAMILAEALFAAPLGRVTDRIGRKKMFYILTPIYCLSYVIYVLAPSQEWLLLAGFLMGFIPHGLQDALIRGLRGDDPRAGPQGLHREVEGADRSVSWAGVYTRTISWGVDMGEPWTHVGLHNPDPRGDLHPDAATHHGS